MYDANYFIKKFEAIPEKAWSKGWKTDDGSKCALGHCGQSTLCHYTEESRALADLFFKHQGLNVWPINDMKFKAKLAVYNQETPKQRVLAALYDIREATLKAVKPEVKAECR